MKYKKEIKVIVIIFCLITVIDIFTKRNTEFVMENMINELNKLYEQISREEKYNINLIYDIEKSWKEKMKVMSLYLEHNELEKVNNSLAKLKSNVESKEKYMAVENIEETKFLIEHIKNKNLLNIENIF